MRTSDRTQVQTLKKTAFAGGEKAALSSHPIVSPVGTPKQRADQAEIKKWVQFMSVTNFRPGEMERLELSISMRQLLPICALDLDRPGAESKRKPPVI